MRKAKHEEHENHERWLVCYADMVTLLFAMFVLLYSMGVRDELKVKKVLKGIPWAFHHEGSGRTFEDGQFEQGKGGGVVPEALPLYSAQEGPMEEFLDEHLKEDFKRVSGRSLDIDVVNDEVRVTSSLSAWFEGYQGDRFRHGKKTYGLLRDMVLAVQEHVARVNIRIEAHYYPISQRDGRRWSSNDLCHERLSYFHRALRITPGVRIDGVTTEYGELRGRFRGNWQDVARVVISFTDPHYRESSRGRAGRPGSRTPARPPGRRR